MAQTYRTLVFRLRALTNMHPGSGDSFYGAVDKLVQRDATTNRPTIHSHSLKGALREYFEETVKADAVFINRIFGSPVSERDQSKVKPGAYRFFSADLLALPVPDIAADRWDTPFRLAVAPGDLKRCADKLMLLGCTDWKDEMALKKALELEGTAIRTDEDFPRLFGEHTEELPLVARNCLDNGKSENLWYEELVPRESIFVFAVQADAVKKDMDLFVKHLDNQVFQIGANATVGYGYSLLTLLNKPA